MNGKFGVGSSMYPLLAAINIDDRDNDMLGIDDNPLPKQMPQISSPSVPSPNH